MKQHIIVEQLGQGLAVTRSIKMKYIMNSVRIKNSTALLSTGAITTKEFLLQCSHTTDRYLERELSWGDEHLSMLTKHVYTYLLTNKTNNQMLH